MKEQVRVHHLSSLFKEVFLLLYLYENPMRNERVSI
jgi:hypothetical protein